MGAASGMSEPAEHKRLREIFQKVDLNGDGSLNKRELIKMLRQNPDVASFFGLPTHIRQEDGSRDLLEAWFQKIDSDDNREITWEEFRDFHARGRRLSIRMFPP